MCGLSGYFKSNRLNGSYIEEMAESLSHRGPDNTSFFHDETILLAHNRLSIIDLDPRSNQPFYSRNGRYVMIYNGEIYNFQEIASQLNIDLVTKSDTEVVLEAYVKWGKSFTDKLNGMFAIAIYDKEEKSLCLWRDRVGIKPLYYYWDGKDFAFASELKALLKLPFSREINSTALNDYLFLEYIPQPNSIFKNFFKLESGCSLEFKNGGIKKEKYYDLLDKIQETDEKSEAAYLEEFKDLFESSLRYRSISDVPIGAFLSGGLDSSSVCFGLKDIGTDLSTFNIGFSERNYDESKYAQEISGYLNSHHYSQNLTDNDLLDSMDFLLKQYDEPFAVSSIFPTYKVSQMAKKNITVALSGDGGDELFMGYGHYNWFNRLSGLDSKMGQQLRKLSSSLFSNVSGRYGRISALLDYDNVKKDWPHIWSAEQYMFSEKEVSSLTGSIYENQGLRESWSKISAATSDNHLRISLFDLKHYLPDDLLYKVDMASMANSLEVRLPFLDHRLVEFAINLPSKYKYRQKQQKYLLRKYLQDKIPNKLIDRKKWGFGAPVDIWLQGSLKNLLHETLNEESIKKSDVFDYAEVKKKIKDFESGKTHDYKKLWALFTFQIWYKNYS